MKFRISPHFSLFVLWWFCISILIARRKLFHLLQFAWLSLSLLLSHLVFEFDPVFISVLWNVNCWTKARTFVLSIWLLVCERVLLISSVICCLPFVPSFRWFFDIWCYLFFMFFPSGSLIHLLNYSAEKNKIHLRHFDFPSRKIKRTSRNHLHNIVERIVIHLFGWCWCRCCYCARGGWHFSFKLLLKHERKTVHKKNVWNEVEDMRMEKGCSFVLDNVV